MGDPNLPQCKKNQTDVAFPPKAAVLSRCIEEHYEIKNIFIHEEELGLLDSSVLPVLRLCCSAPPSFGDGGPDSDSRTQPPFDDSRDKNPPVETIAALKASQRQQACEEAHEQGQNMINGMEQ